MKSLLMLGVACLVTLPLSAQGSSNLVNQLLERKIENAGIEDYFEANPSFAGNDAELGRPCVGLCFAHNLQQLAQIIREKEQKRGGLSSVRRQGFVRYKKRGNLAALRNQGFRFEIQTKLETINTCNMK
eukprot:TRINITY_DN27013_c0_g1_i1.p1 TRINITY_DN27013_c0_g1~~TRINITY_DN27013_c0_g1_i1.p1  ORF type:complete len:129 (-),score=28.72 TRINITY_DN27013_c0_g1_i1:51-437(-)